MRRTAEILQKIGEVSCVASTKKQHKIQLKDSLKTEGHLRRIAFFNFRWFCSPPWTSPRTCWVMEKTLGDWRVLWSIGKDWRDPPKRSPVLWIFADFHPDQFEHYTLCIHRLLLAIWSNKPFRTMTLKSSCAALEWLDRDFCDTPAAGNTMPSPSLMDALTCSNMILNHIVAQKLARCNGMSQNQRFKMEGYAGSDRQRLGYHECHHDVFCCPNGSSHLKMRSDSMESLCLHSWQQCNGSLFIAVF